MAAVVVRKKKKKTKFDDCHYDCTAAAAEAIDFRFGLVWSENQRLKWLVGTTNSSKKTSARIGCLTTVLTSDQQSLRLLALLFTRWSLEQSLLLFYGHNCRCTMPLYIQYTIFSFSLYVISHSLFLSLSLFFSLPFGAHEFNIDTGEKKNENKRERNTGGQLGRAKIYTAAELLLFVSVSLLFSRFLLFFFVCCRVFWGSPEKMIFERATSSVQWSSGQSGYQVWIIYQLFTQLTFNAVRMRKNWLFNDWTNVWINKQMNSLNKKFQFNLIT